MGAWTGWLADAGYCAGGRIARTRVGNRSSGVAEPEVHVLEASTGKERHRVLGL